MEPPLSRVHCNIALRCDNSWCQTVCPHCSADVGFVCGKHFKHIIYNSITRMCQLTRQTKIDLEACPSAHTTQAAITEEFLSLQTCDHSPNNTGFIWVMSSATIKQYYTRECAYYH